jgi:hypothetical protein
LAIPVIVFSYFRLVKKIFLKTIFLLLPLISFSQEGMHPIVGKWKVVQINNGVIVNFKSNTSIVSDQLAQSLAGNKDSLVAIEVFTKMAKKYNDYYFVFGKDGLYKEIMNGEVRNDLATYHLLEEEHLVYMSPARETNNTEQSMIYDVRKDDTMELSIFFMDRKMTLELERVKDVK